MAARSVYKRREEYDEVDDDYGDDECICGHTRDQHERHGVMHACEMPHCDCVDFEEA